MRSTLPPPDIEYPDTDGQPMANNTIQAQVMMTLKENIEAMFRHRNDVCIAIDLFWYPVQGRNDIRHAPDVMVALGRPKGHRFPAYLELREALERAVEQARLEAEQERRLREQERQIREREARRALEAERRLQQERQRAEQAEAELQRLRQLLRERGIDDEPNDSN